MAYLSCDLKVQCPMVEPGGDDKKDGLENLVAQEMTIAGWFG